MARYEIIQAQGEVQMMKRDWWQLYKRGWQKHRDFWNRRWWIRFKWDAESNVPQRIAAMPSWAIKLTNFQ